jgi:hypothetical protein
MLITEESGCKGEEEKKKRREEEKGDDGRRQVKKLPVRNPSPVNFGGKMEIRQGKAVRMKREF